MCLAILCCLLTHQHSCPPSRSHRDAGFGWGKIAGGVAAGWLLGGKFHSSRLQKKLNAKHKQEQKEVYQQYYNDVYALQQQNTELINALEQFGARVR